MLPFTLAGYGCSGTAEVKNPLGEARGALQQAQSCSDLETMLKADAVAKMNAQIDAIIHDIEVTGDYFGGGVPDWEGGSGGVNSGSSSSGTGTGTGGASGGSGGAGGNGSPPPDHSDTNTQVAGVDEADILKTDGNFIYLLHGNDLQVLKSWPVSDLAINATTDVDGNPIEMFVTDDQIVVYSQVDGTDIYAAAGVSPRAPYYDYQYGYAGDGPAYDGYGNPYYAPLTKVTVYSLANGQTTGAQKELYFEGNYASSRRVGQYVRTVLSGGQHGPNVSYFPDTSNHYPETADEWIQAFENLRFQNTISIYGTTLTDWLPYRFEKTASGVVALPPSCESYYVPSSGSTSYGLVQVESFDLQNLGSALEETSIVGAVDTVYANEDALYLAARGYRDPVMGYEPPVAATDVTDTYVHKFDLATNPAVPAYVATGHVLGYAKNQFSLDEKDGRLRIATTRELSSQTEWTTTNALYVLEQSGDELVEVGKVDNLATGERIYSTRFVGDRGYVVTFRQVDPLFVIDLANPQHPAVKGELEIPGFSEYMHPIDDNHLLTIGQDANAQGQVQGLALQLFDVTNPQSPALLFKHSFTGNDYGYSEAQYNHKAFNWYGPKNLLAFPFSGYNAVDGTMRSSLELFEVTLAGGIVKKGSIDHSQFFASDPYGYCNGYYGVDVRRGVFIDDYVYAVSFGGVTASSVNDPLDPVASVALPTPSQPYGYCGF